ncbi:MAG: hypothetical protein QM831_23755 [Kofleriaceae bacterium]
MRLIVIGALVLVALAIGLLHEVSGHADVSTHVSAPIEAPHVTTKSPDVAPLPPVETKEAARAPAPTRGPIAVQQPAIQAQEPAAPGKPKHVDTPMDILRWSLMRQIRNSEPGVIECLEKAKAAGTVVDGSATFAFMVTKKNDKGVIDAAGVDRSPFPADVNKCITATLATGELDQDLPEGKPLWRVLRKLTVEKGAITEYKLQSYIEPQVSADNPPEAQ